MQMLRTCIVYDTLGLRHRVQAENYDSNTRLLTKGAVQPNFSHAIY
jgi:hypothetical protein